MNRAAQLVRTKSGVCPVDAGHGLVHADTVVATTDDVLVTVSSASHLELVVGDRSTAGPVRDLELRPGTYEAQLTLSCPGMQGIAEDVRLMLVEPDSLRREFGARTASLGYDLPVIVGAGLEGKEERAVSWDELWPDGGLTDVVVDFEAPYKLVLWRGAGYVPAWTANNTMTTNFFAETVEPGVFRDCCEPMSDRECRYSRARIVHSSPARVVLHWRYALCDPTYEICRGYWADETYYVYPDGVAVRNCTVKLDPRDEDVWRDEPGRGRVPCTMFSCPPGKRAFSNMEFITVNPPGLSSEDVTPPGAFTMLDGSGFRQTYSWPHPPAFPKVPFPALNEYIFRMNYRDRPAVFLASPSKGVEFLFQDNVGMQYVAAADVRDDQWVSVDGLPGRFADFIHWPVSRDTWTSALTDPETGQKRPTHTFLGFAGNAPVLVEEDGAVTWSWFCGMSPEDDGALRSRANSWLHPTEIDGARYDPRQGAYVIEAGEDAGTWSLDLPAPLCHPSFVLPGVDRPDLRVYCGGGNVPARIGVERTDDELRTVITPRSPVPAGTLTIGPVGS